MVIAHLPAAKHAVTPVGNWLTLLSNSAPQTRSFPSIPPCFCINHNRDFFPQEMHFGR